MDTTDDDLGPLAGFSPAALPVSEVAGGDDDLGPLAAFVPGQGNTKPPPGGNKPPPKVGPEPGDDTNYAEMGWSPVLNSAIGNFGKSGRKELSAVYDTVAHPIETAKAIGQIGTGIGSKVSGYFGAQQDPKQKATDEAAANAIGEHFSNYFEPGGLKKAIANDPVSVLMDFSTVASGGQLALGRAPGLIGKAARVAGSVGSAVDPIQNVWRVAKVGAYLPQKLVKAVVPHFQAAGTGVDANAFKLAGEFGASSDPVVKEAFRMGVKDKTSGYTLVDKVDDGIRDIADDRGAAYVKQARREGVKGAAPGTMPALDWRPINDAVSKIKNEIYATDQFGRVVENVPEAIPAYNKIVAEIANRQASLPGSTHHTLEGFDGLKKNISSVIDSAGPNQSQRWVGTAMYNAVLDEITKKHPGYAAIMKEYQDASKQLKDLRASLGAGKSGNAAAASGQMVKILRQYKKGDPGNLIAALAAKDPTIIPMLTGRALSEVLPGGLRGFFETPAAIAAFMVHPALPLSLVGSSPRIMGELNYRAGQATRLPGQVTPLRGDLAYQGAALTHEQQQPNSPTQQRPQVLPVQTQKPVLSGAALPRNMRNNNPANIEDGPYARSQPGYAGGDGRFARFQSQAHGDAAGDGLLRRYGSMGRDTPEKVVTKWSPYEDNPAASVRASIARVASALGVRADDRIDMMNPEIRKKVYAAIVRGEANTGGRIQRATGGKVQRVNHEAEAAKLVRAADASRKRLGERTEPLLDSSDTMVAHALAVVNKAI